MKCQRGATHSRASQLEDGGMTLPVMNVQTPARHNNMRLVLIDDQQQAA